MHPRAPPTCATQVLYPVCGPESPFATAWYHGLIAGTEFTGKQWRIPLQEVERMEREGVPPVPISVPDPVSDRNTDCA